jgi:hypothetical protein
MNPNIYTPLVTIFHIQNRYQLLETRPSRHPPIHPFLKPTHPAIRQKHFKKKYFELWILTNYRAFKAKSIYIYIYILIYISIYIKIIFFFRIMCVCVCVCLCGCVFVYAHAHAPTQAHTHKHRHTHKHTHTHTHTYTHTTQEAKCQGRTGHLAPNTYRTQNCIAANTYCTQCAVLHSVKHLQHTLLQMCKFTIFS